MKKSWIILSSILLMATILPPKKKITIWMCGDSTMSIKETGAYPETGWGMPFVYFWDSAAVRIMNKAKNGRSTRTFISEGIWQSVIENVQEGDFVFIEFGHNDESKEKKERYTTTEEFKNNLSKFIAEAQSKKAIPVLFTPVSRRKFNSEGKAIETHKDYSQAMRELADSLKMPLIDMDKKTMELYDQFGEKNSRYLFLQLQPGQHPNYPNGKEDNTHFSELGARLTAEIAWKEFLQLYPAMTECVVKPIKK